MNKCFTLFLILLCLFGAGELAAQEFSMKKELDFLQTQDTFPTNFTRSKSGVTYFRAKQLALFAKRDFFRAKLDSLGKKRKRRKFGPMVSAWETHIGDVEKELEFVRFRLYQEFLRAGETDSAIAVLLRSLRSGIDPEALDQLPHLSEFHTGMGLAWFRKGEQLNCQENHNPASCLLPFKEAAYHLRPEGARKAIHHLSLALEGNPKNADAMWLLNIAHMSLGTYPDSVPAAFRLDLEKYEAENSELRPFVEVAGKHGVAYNGHLGGAGMEDLNNDGFLDLFSTSFKLEEPPAVYLSFQKKTFVEQTNSFDIAGLGGGSNLIHGDFNNDGFADLYVSRGGWLERAGNLPDSYWLNERGLSFEESAKTMGLLLYRPSQTACTADFDNDGDLDLFIGCEYGQNETPGEPMEQPSAFFQNDGEGNFSEMDVFPINKWVKGAISADFNNDGWADLYLSCFGEENLLLINGGAQEGGWLSFTEMAEKAGVAEPLNSFSTVSLDFNNDGWEDIFVSGYLMPYQSIAGEYAGLSAPLAPPRLFLNQQDGTFQEAGPGIGLDRTFYTMGLNVGDVDNDGWQDLYLATGAPSYAALLPNTLLRNDEGERYVDVTSATRLGHLQKGHGIAFGDIDNDGDQDIYLNAGGFFDGDDFTNCLFLNPGNENKWINLKLTGIKANRSAIGARIKIVVMEEGERREIYRRVGTGGSFGANSLQAEIGLGKASSIEEAEIIWPGSGTVQPLTGLEMNSFFWIQEENPPIRIGRPVLDLTFPQEKHPEKHHHHHEH